MERKTKDLRNKRNQDLIRRMNEGEVLCSFDSKDSWFPPRPIIKKDKKALKRLYEKTGKNSEESDVKPSIVAVQEVVTDDSDLPTAG